MNDGVPRHPGAQTMAAFVEGRLAPQEIAAVAGHLRDCSDCRLVVTETARFEREEERAGSSRSNRLWWLAVAAAIAAIAIAVPLLRRSESHLASPMARLIEVAPRRHRLVEARLTGFPWARLQAPSRGNAVPDPADLKLAGAAGEVLEKTASRNDPLSRQATGVAYLLIGRRSESIAALASATTDSKDAAAWNDLAAARYAMAVQDEHPAQLPEALADVDHAVRINPRLAEALFNRALILEHLGVREQARKAWQRYLEVDPGGDWSVEARAHLRALESVSSRFDPKLLESAPADQLVRAFPQEARTWSEGVLLPDWADQEAAGNSLGASEKLVRVRAIANALAAFNGEYLLDDAVTAVERSTGSNRGALVEGHRLYYTARIDYRKRNAGTAEKEFRRAATLFQKGGSAMDEVASYFAASAAFDQHRGDQAREELRQLLSSNDRTRHRALNAQILWELAVVANADGDWGSGARQGEASATVFRALGEQTYAAFVDAVAAAAFEVMGERDLAWSRRIRSHAVLSATTDRTGQSAMLHAEAITLTSLDQTQAAESLLGLMIDEARRDPAQLAAVLSDQALDAVRGGNVDDARGSLSEARNAATHVSDPALREIVDAQINLADATIRRRGEPLAAIALLDRTIAFLGAGRLRLLLPRARLERARAYRSAGNDKAALADCETALGEIDKERASIQDGDLRLSFLDTAAEIIAETIDLQLSHGNVEASFAVAEHAHAVLDESPRRGSRTAAARSPLPPGVVMIEYAVLPHAIALFCLSNGGVTAEKVDVDRRVLEARIESFTERIRNRTAVEKIHSDGAVLYSLLIAPLQRRLRLSGVDEIVLVPDRQLYSVPFAALWDATSHQYLTEQFTIRFAAAARADTMAGDQSLSPALVIADPPTAHWPRLVAAREEAARIAALYGATLLDGEAATRARFVDMARNSALIHYAGHANSDASESYGALLLASSANDTGVLGSSEIAALALTRRPLVILAACGTFRGNAAHVSGMTSLARSFLLAGARGVVGTLWEVDDDVSAPLFFRLHEHIRAGASPARALHAMQIEMLHASDARANHPATWSPIEYLSSL
jgi:CHAT domain-containing protein/tetratricopeptide (TPR) repeat protein